MSTLSFRNAGLIDPRAYSLFGASAKVGDTPIGFFGTGLKYAIAIFLRNGCKVTLWRGLDRVEFTAESVNMRGSEFSVVCANGTELSYTTELGKTWKPWQAMRELWCNAIDEGGSVADSPFAPQDGHTTITVTGAAAAEAWSERDSVFLSGRTSWDINGVEIHDRPSRSIYYRGIRVMDLDAPALFTYNITGHKVDLTEDRTIKYSFYAKHYISKALVATDCDRLAARVIDASENTFEGKLDFGDEEPSETFDRVLRDQVKLRHDQNGSLRKLMRRRHGMEGILSPVELRHVEVRQLEKAKVFCTHMNLDVAKFPIIVTDGLEEGLLGIAERTSKRIYLSRRVFMMGTKQVAGTLFEELLHLQHGVDDCDREMQNRLIDTIVTMYEDSTGEPL